MKRLLTMPVCLIIALALLASCGSAPPAPGEALQQQAAPPSASPGSPPSGTDQALIGAPYSRVFDESIGSLPILTPSQMDGRMISYDVQLDLQTTEFMKGVRLLFDTVAETGGYIETEHLRGRDMKGPETERSDSFSFRVPSERLKEFLVMVENNFNMAERRMSSKNDTTAYRRADTRLDDLREQEQRLLDDLRRTGIEAEDRLEIERELSKIQTSISDLTAQQMNIDYDVYYSNVSATLREVIFTEETEVPAPAFGERLDGRVSASIAAFVAFCQWVLLAVISIAPALVVLAVLGLIAWLIVRAVKKRGHKKSLPVAVIDDEKPAESEDE